jgi:hypothetical protein
MSYVPTQNKSPFAVARGSATNRYNDIIEPVSREDDLVGAGSSNGDLIATSSAGQTVKMFTLFQPSWKRPTSVDTLASYAAYTGADQSEMLHCRTDVAGDFYGGLDDSAISPQGGVDFTAYSVFGGGWPSYVNFHSPRSSALVWFT